MKTIVKKQIVFVGVLLQLVFGLVGCGSNNNSGSSAITNQGYYIANNMCYLNGQVVGQAATCPVNNGLNQQMYGSCQSNVMVNQTPVTTTCVGPYLYNGQPGTCHGTDCRGWELVNAQTCQLTYCM